jgi:signal transduction histidine kinase
MFLANMSHELRTPLNAIMGYCDLLAHPRTGVELGERHAGYLANIAAASEHLLSIVNDILDLSKIEAGRMELDRSVFDLVPAVAAIFEMLTPLGQSQGVTLVSQLPEGPRQLWADERSFRQMLLNLVSNAVKFSSKGGMSGWDAARNPRARRWSSSAIPGSA